MGFAQGQFVEKAFDVLLILDGRRQKQKLGKEGEVGCCICRDGLSVVDRSSSDACASVFGSSRKEMGKMGGGGLFTNFSVEN